METSRKKHNKSLVPLARQLRKTMTKEEKHLWYDFLRTYPVKFVRQKIFDRYIADFYCARAKLVLELDGSQHYEEENQIQDALRTEKLQQFGVSVIRISNHEIRENFEGVCCYIHQAVQQSLSQPKG